MAGHIDDFEPLFWMLELIFLMILLISLITNASSILIWFIATIMTALYVLFGPRLIE